MYMTDAGRSQGGFRQLWQYMRALVDRKQAEPDDDVISDLVAAAAADPELTADGIATISAKLMLVGPGATVAAIDRGVALLLIHPEQADALRQEPGLIKPAVEEILRAWLPSRTSRTEQAVGLPRYANTDFTFGGVTIRTGELVMLGLRAANLDERFFPEPDRFDVRRTPNPHLAFGHGPHYCAAAQLARIELQMLFPALLDQFPTLRLAVPVECLAVPVDSLRGSEDVIGRDLVELPVRW